MWYLLNHIPRSAARAAQPQAVIERFNRDYDARLELFAPTFIKMVKRGGKLTRTDTPLLFHYTFVRGSDAAVKALCAKDNGFSYVLSHNPSTPYVTLQDAEIEAYKIIAAGYGNTLPCYTPGELDLQEGDLVEVIAGDFPGLRGRYLPKKGGNSGNIILQTTQNLGVVVYDIRADYVKILEFARDTKRPYDQIDAHERRILPLLHRLQPVPTTTPLPPFPCTLSPKESFLAPIPYLLSPKESFLSPIPCTLSPKESFLAPIPCTLSPKETTYLRTFLLRYADTRFKNPKIEARYATHLKIAARLTGDQAAEAAAEARLQATLPHLTNPKTRTHLLHLLSLLP